MARKPTVAEQIQAGTLTPTTPYQKRIARGLKRGYTTAQARGHARQNKGELPVSVANVIKVPKLKLRSFARKKSNWASVDVSEKDLPFILDNIDKIRGKYQRAFIDVTYTDAQGKVNTVRTRTVGVTRSTTMLHNELNKVLNKYGIRGRDYIAMDMDSGEDRSEIDDLLDSEEYATDISYELVFVGKSK